MQYSYTEGDKTLTFFICDNYYNDGELFLHINFQSPDSNENWFWKFKNGSSLVRENLDGAWLNRDGNELPAEMLSFISSFNDKDKVLEEIIKAANYVNSDYYVENDCKVVCKKTKENTEHGKAVFYPEFYWNSDQKYYEMELAGHVLTIWPELVGYSDKRISLKINYNHTDYKWSYLDDLEKISINGKTQRSYEKFGHVPNWLISDLSFEEGEQFLDLLVAAARKSRSKYECSDGGALNLR